MARQYQLAIASVAAATGAAYMTIHTGSTNRIKLREVTIQLNAATASSFALGRPGNTPVATTSTLGLALDPNDPASGTNVDTAWSTAPTTPSNFFTRNAFPATAGLGAQWVWSADAPLLVSASSWIVLWNFGGGTASVQQVTWKWEE